MTAKRKPAKPFDWLKDKPLSAAALAKLETAEEKARAVAARRRKKLQERRPEHTAASPADLAVGESASQGFSEGASSDET